MAFGKSAAPGTQSPEGLDSKLSSPNSSKGEQLPANSDKSSTPVIYPPPIRGYQLAMSERIAFNPNQRGGRPCIRGMRIRVKDDLDLLAAGVPEEEILEDYPISNTRISSLASNMPPPRLAIPFLFGHPVPLAR